MTVRQMTLDEAIDRRKMPAQKPGKSKQDYATPWEFIDAVEKRFGRMTFDLAATGHNYRVRVEYLSFKHYFTPEIDSLAQDWKKLRGNLWLNPPYGHIDPWAKKCAETTPVTTSICGRRIFFLVPASIGANWFADHVFQKARVIALQGRLSFDGVSPYPKDCMLAVFGEKPGFEVWDWRQGVRRA
jgi:phage N-6-adenine-methyltransferase